MECIAYYTGVTGTDPKCQVPGQAHIWILLIGRLVGDFNDSMIDGNYNHSLVSVLVSVL